MSAAALPVVYAGCDWLSLTTGDNDDAQTAYAKARALALEQETEGNRVTPWASHGYKGFGAPHIRCGQRDGDVLVELSGTVARKYWRDFYPLAKNVSRIDTCVDVTHDPPRGDLAYDAWKAPGVALRPGRPPIEKRIIMGTGGGQTCYVGSPRSERMGRLYDKSAESPGDYPAGTWRYECQERGPVGRLVASGLYGSDDVPRAVTAHVFNFFRVRGVNPWFLADGPALPGQIGHPRSDMSRWLGWLRTQVRPGVRRWDNRATRTAIVEALGWDLRELQRDGTGEAVS